MKLKWIVLGVGFAALAGCDVPPEGTSAEDVARFQAAAATIGCEMIGESDYLPVELQAGLTRQQAQDITGFLLATEQAVRLDNGGVRITSGACAPTV